MIWRDIPGYENYYQVSNCGKVKSLQRYVKHLHGPKFVCERILKLNTDKYGYKTVVLQVNGKAKTLKVHRLVAMCFIGNSDLLVNHIDCDKSNNNLVNLEYVTNQENVNHARGSGAFRVIRGDKHKNSRLSNDDRKNILSLFDLGIDRKKIASIYGIHEMHVYRTARLQREGFYE